MNLEYKSGRRSMDARFIESNLGGINIISEIFDCFTIELGQGTLNRMNSVLSLQVTVDYIKLWV